MIDDDATGRAGRFTIPHRSAADHKIAGVAGGIGRALSIDPIVIRVLFVILAIFGGAGVLVYCLAWLFMPADGEEVSAAESLAGRGHSSVSPALAIALIIVAVASAGSAFSWGVGFLPVVIAAIIVFTLLVVRRGDAPRRSDWGKRADELADRIGQWGERLGEQAGAWGSRVGDQMSAWADGRSRVDDDPASPSAGQAGPPDPSSATAGAADTDAATAAGTTADDVLSDDRTPPAWDPLGAAPFAWDLPEPTQAVVTEPSADRRGVAAGRLVLGIVLIVGATVAALTAAGRLSLTWAAVSGITLGVLAIGLAAASLFAGRARGLIGPGIFLVLVTLALTATGLRGTTGFGEQTWAPTSADQVAGSYLWNAGQTTLDLSGVTIPKGTEVSTTVTVHAGRALVIVPSGVAVTAQCAAQLGSVDCLGAQSSGVNPHHLTETAGRSDQGRLHLDVQANAGRVVVRHGH